MNGSAVVLAVGDIILDEPGLEGCFAPAAPVVRAADVAIGHVEVPHTTRVTWQPCRRPAST